MLYTLCYLKKYFPYVLYRRKVGLYYEFLKNVFEK